jgi:hypothetical protein
MISLIISLFPIFLIIFYFFYIKRVGGLGTYVKNLSNKKNGISCYECNSDLDLFPVKHDPKVCQSCERDRRVKFLINPLKSKYYDFDKIFFDAKFDKYLSILLFIAIGLILFDVVLIFFDIRMSSIPNNILLVIYWLLMIYRIKVVMKGYKK